jgi:hypothetical protein
LQRLELHLARFELQQRFVFGVSTAVAVTVATAIAVQLIKELIVDGLILRKRI